MLLSEFMMILGETEFHYIIWSLCWAAKRADIRHDLTDRLHLDMCINFISDQSASLN